jgi:hypothetical protein
MEYTCSIVMSNGEPPRCRVAVRIAAGLVRVAIYARYSSENQRDASNADQFRVCREFAQRQCWHIAAEFSDYAVSGATIVNALDAAADTATSNTEAAGQPTTRARQRAAGLVELATAFLGGTTASGQPRRARPQLVVHVPLDQVTATAAGQVELNLAGARLPTVTARTLEALNTDADLRAVLFDGSRPLAVSDKVSASEIPTKTRVAVAARDRGCRFPGSRTPIAHTDIDHQTPWENGGTTGASNTWCLHKGHHLGKTHHRYTIHTDTHGTTWWTTPAGHHNPHTARRQPAGPCLPAPAGGEPATRPAATPGPGRARLRGGRRRSARARRYAPRCSPRRRSA